jgi:uncharacterized membrane protein (DUF2068 family)
VQTHGASVLPWIIGFKAFKTVTLTTLGITLFVTRHADPVDVLVRAALAVHLPVTSVLFDRVLSIALHLTVNKQVALAVTAFAYATLMGTEGVSLYLRKAWARWFTIIATGSFIPIELYEIVRGPHVIRVIVLLLNIMIIVWLWQRAEPF